MAAIELIGGATGDEWRANLWRNARALANGLGVTAQSAILPVILGSSEAAIAAADRLREWGILIPAIRYPTVPRGRARLRVTLSAAHQPEEIGRLLGALGNLGLPEK